MNSGDNLIRGADFDGERSPFWNFGAYGGYNIYLYLYMYKNKKSL